MKLRMLTALILAILILLVSFVGFVIAQGPTRFVGDVTITRDLVVQDDLTVTDIFAVSGNTSALGDFTVDDTFNIDDNSYVLTGTQTLTPSASLYLLAPPTALTLTLGAGTAGDLLILVNTVSTSTVIVDTGATAGGGNITLGADDPAMFIYTTKWVEWASPDNS